MAKIKRPITTNVSNHVEQLEFIYISCGHIKSYIVTLESCLVVSYKIKHLPIL